MKHRIVKDNHTDCCGQDWYVLQKLNGDDWVQVDSGYLETMQRRKVQLQNPVRFAVIEEFEI